MPGFGAVRGIIGKNRDIQFGQAHQSKGERKIKAQAIVLYLNAQARKFAQSHKVDGVRLDSFTAKKGRVLLPLRKQVRRMHPSGKHGLDIAGVHACARMSRARSRCESMTGAGSVCQLYSMVRARGRDRFITCSSNSNISGGAGTA